MQSVSLQFLLIELEHVDGVDEFRLALGIFGYFGGELIDRGLPLRR
jgi:hypothetical protein